MRLTVSRMNTGYSTASQTHRRCRSIRSKTPESKQQWRRWLINKFYKRNDTHESKFDVWELRSGRTMGRHSRLSWAPSLQAVQDSFDSRPGACPRRRLEAQPCGSHLVQREAKSGFVGTSRKRNIKSKRAPDQRSLLHSLDYGYEDDFPLSQYPDHCTPKTQTVQPGDTFEDNAFKPGFDIVKS